MEYTINENILSIPPFISTKWANIKAMQTEMDGESMLLILQMTDGNPIRIPGLSVQEIKEIFNYHVKSQSSASKEEAPSIATPFGLFQGKAGDKGGGLADLPFGANGFEGLGAALEHNPSQSNLPDLPPELLKKVSGVAKLLSQEESLPSPEVVDGCNCLHCQIARAVRVGIGANEDLVEEEVSDEDLTFKEWDIEQKDEKLYKVSNPLNKNEEYSVYLGDPLGCTCGEKNCDHIKAVLST